LAIDEIVLRPWRRTDAAELLNACQDPEIALWVDIPQPFLAADADAFIEGAMKMWRDGTGAPFAIVEAGTDGLLGAVTRFGPEGHQATLGCWVAPWARRRRIGTRSLQIVTEWTFATTPTFRLDAFIMVGNEPTERMVELVGFQREGVLRAWEMTQDGVPVDCVVYSRLRSDGQ
jgi:RimJ/RimL family protein N-acetyltransferase